MLFIIGPCAMEGKQSMLDHAKAVKALEDKFSSRGAEFIFKSCYNKANRSDVSSFHGVGLEKGVEFLKMVKKEFGLKVTSDVHSEEEIRAMSLILDLIQIPQSLSRYTNIIQAAAATGTQISIKKGVFMSHRSSAKAVEKATAAGAKDVILIERGNSYGPNDLVVDYRNLIHSQSLDNTVTCFDATHSALDRKLAPDLAYAAIALGVDTIFAECHLDPESALCDGKCMINMADMETFISNCLEVRDMRSKLK